MDFCFLHKALYNSHKTKRVKVGQKMIPKSWSKYNMILTIPSLPRTIYFILNIKNKKANHVKPLSDRRKLNSRYVFFWGKSQYRDSRFIMFETIVWLRQGEASSSSAGFILRPQIRSLNSKKLNDSWLQSLQNIW